MEFIEVSAMSSILDTDEERINELEEIHLKSSIKRKKENVCKIS